MSRQASAMTHPHKMQMVTVFGNRAESVDKDSRLVNCFAEKDLETGEYWVQKRVGLAIQSTLSGIGLGMYNWNGVVYSVFGTGLYQDGVLLGTVDDTTSYSFTQLRGEPERLVLGNGVAMYYVEYNSTLAAYVLKEIPDYVPAYAGSFATGSSYTILSTGDTDWIACGASATPTTTTEIEADQMVVGTTYVITDLGSYYTVKVSGGSVTYNGVTNFILYGALTNVVGVSFTATGAPAAFKNGRVVAAIPAGSGDTFTAANAGNGNGFCALNVDSLIVGQSYQINQIGTTDFTAIGAANNTVGTTFVATGKGTGTGNVLIPNSFPGDFCKGFVYLDGTLYVMDLEGNIYGSKYLDDPTLWDPLNVIVARIEPDNGVALAKQQSYVIAMKQWTTEVFYDAGNPTGSPLASVPGAKAPYGCVSADSVQEIDDRLYWIASNRTVSPQIVRMESLRVEVISTPRVENLLDQADFSTVFSWNFKHGGHRFYGVTVKNLNLTLVYDIDQGLWYQWTDEDGNYWKIVSKTFSADNKHIAQHETNGKIYYVEGDYEYPTDDGAVVPVDIITRNHTFDVDRRKVLSQMRFNGDQVTGSTLQVRVSDNDYQTWSQFRTVDLGKIRPILSSCGTFYRRAWHLRHQCPTAFRVKSVELQMDVGTL